MFVYGKFECGYVGQMPGLLAELELHAVVSRPVRLLETVLKPTEKAGVSCLTQNFLSGL